MSRVCTVERKVIVQLSLWLVEEFEVVSPLPTVAAVLMSSWMAPDERGLSSGLILKTAKSWRWRPRSAAESCASGA